MTVESGKQAHSLPYTDSHTALEERQHAQTQLDASIRALDVKRDLAASG